MRPTLRAGLLCLALLALVAAPSVPAGAIHDGETEVTVGSNDSIFSQNKQNEPAVVIDPFHPNVVAAGANDNIDMEACEAGDPTTCPFTPDVGGSGIAFSFDFGDTWDQPTYTGLTARDCLGDPDPAVVDDECVAHQGPIGTLPKYDDAGLVSDGDPALAFGPIPGEDGTFDWDNGSRLYYANLTSNVSFSETAAFKGFEAIAVSRIDGDPALTPAIVDDEDNWFDPVIVSKQSGASFADKEQLWVDNAESSEFFGHAYVCYAEFRGGGAAPLVLSTSTDGGDTWSTDQVTPGHNVAPSRWGQSGCTIRTDSDGVVYVMFELFQNPEFFLPPHGAHMLVRSFDGGQTWERPELIRRITDPCFTIQFDGAGFRCVMDGIAGARNDLAASPSIDIANGAPTGEGATDVIYSTYIDAEDGQDDEHVMLSASADGGENWTEPEAVESDAEDRGLYAAVALSPDGTDAYLVYNAFTTPFRDNTTEERVLVGVVLHSDVEPDGDPVGFTEVHRGLDGEPRGSSQNNLVLEFLGDYVYADAMNDFGVAVWQDARNASDCPAVDSWRAGVQTSLSTANPPDVPALCPDTFGNTDIFSWSGADPS
jgi:hypothetical protein